MTTWPVRFEARVSSARPFSTRLQLVRHKAKDLAALIVDDERLKSERKLAKKNKDKYKGLGSEDLGMGGRSSQRTHYDE